MKFTELASKDSKELTKRLNAARNELREIRFRVGRGEEKDVRRIRELRQEIAQLLTKLHS